MARPHVGRAGGSTGPTVALARPPDPPLRARSAPAGAPARLDRPRRTPARLVPAVCRGVRSTAESEDDGATRTGPTSSRLDLVLRASVRGSDRSHSRSPARDPRRRGRPPRARRRIATERSRRCPRPTRTRGVRPPRASCAPTLHRRHGRPVRRGHVHEPGRSGGIRASEPARAAQRVRAAGVPRRPGGVRSPHLHVRRLDALRPERGGGASPRRRHRAGAARAHGDELRGASRRVGARRHTRGSRRSPMSWSPGTSTISQRSSSVPT